MKKVKYQKRDNFFVKGDIQEIGERLASLTGKDGSLKPSAVVDDAQSEDSPLHDNFEWDDTEAAIQHRLSQARYLIRSFEIVYEDHGIDIECRAYVSIDTSDAPYTETRIVLTDEQQRDSWLEQALKELRSWKAKYNHIKELVEVYRVIDEI